MDASHTTAIQKKNPPQPKLGGDADALAAFLTRPQAELQIGAENTIAHFVRGDNVWS
jgi:hypothetical protein